MYDTLRIIVYSVFGIVVMIYICISFHNTVKTNELLHKLEDLKVIEKARYSIEHDSANQEDSDDQQ